MDIDDTPVKDKDTTTATGTADTNKKIVNVPTYEERCLAVNVISHPLASKKTTKKIYKLVKKAASSKMIRRGVKEVVKGIRKNEKGLVILAGDIYPIDVISHIPILLEEYNVPYIYVPSKFDLGASASTKRPTSCVLIRTKSNKSSSNNNNNSKKEEVTFDGQELYDTIYKEAMEYDPTTLFKRKEN